MCFKSDMLDTIYVYINNINTQKIALTQLNINGIWAWNIF